MQDKRTQINRGHSTELKGGSRERRLRKSGQAVFTASGKGSQQGRCDRTGPRGKFPKEGRETRGMLGGR